MNTTLTTLGDCCTIVSGSTPDTNISEYWDGEICWATPKDLSELSSAYIHTTPRKLTRAGLDSCSATILPADSVLFSSRAPIGHVAINTVRMCTNQGFKSFIPDSKKVLAKFLYYWLKFNRKQLENLGNGATFKELSKAIVSQVQILLPPIDEQRRIAAVLDKAEALRAKRRQAISKLDILLHSVFLDMFGDPVTNPKRFPIKPIQEFGSVITGNTPSRSNPEFFGKEIEWIKSDNINSPSYILTKAEEGLSEKGRKVGRVVSAGSSLVTCIAGSPDCIGNVGLADREVAFNQQINAVTPNGETNPSFFYVQLLLAKRLIQRASTNSMKGMVSKSSFSGINLLAPDKPLQDRFGFWFERFLVLHRKSVDAAGVSDTLFRSLQQRAFNGELHLRASSSPSA